MAEGKSHRKKKAGRKAEKRKSAEGKKKQPDGDGEGGAAGARVAISDKQASGTSSRWAACGTGRHPISQQLTAVPLRLPACACVQARKQNPRAFVFASRGKAKIQQSRTAEKEQRRMHGAW
jgi:hypothetical protein